LVQLSLFY